MYINLLKSRNLNIIAYIIVSILFLASNSKADIDGSKQGLSNSLFASFSLHPVEINKQSSLIAGARLLYAFDENFAIGVGSFNMITRNIKSNYFDTIALANPVLEYNYFAGDAEYCINPHDYWVFSVKSTFSVAHVSYNLISTERTTDANYYPSYGDDWFFFVEPSVNLSLNLSYWLKVKFGLGYRFAIDGEYHFNNQNYSNKQLSGFSSGVYLILGNFE